MFFVFRRSHGRDLSSWLLRPYKYDGAGIKGSRTGCATLNHGTTPYLRVGLARGRGMISCQKRDAVDPVTDMFTNCGPKWQRLSKKPRTPQSGSNEHVDFGDHDKRRIHILHGPL